MNKNIVLFILKTFFSKSLMPEIIINPMMIFRSTSALCLRNKPSVTRPNWKKLPGKILTRDEQCNNIFSNVEVR